MAAYLLYPQWLLGLWGPLLVLGGAWLLRGQREKLSPGAGLALSFAVLITPLLALFVPYLPHSLLAELPYRVPLAHGVFNGPEPRHMTLAGWWLTVPIFLLWFGSMVVAALYGMLETAAAAYRVRCLPRTQVLYQGKKLHIVECPGMIAFVQGVWWPQVFLGRDVWDSPHRQAVLAHEEAHRRGRHPLLLALATWAARSFWYLPPAWWLLTEVRLWAELCADQDAARQAGGPALARALRSTVPSSKLAIAPMATGLTGFSAPPHQLTRRVQALLQPGHRLPFTQALLCAALLILAVVLL